MGEKIWKHNGSGHPWAEGRHSPVGGVLGCVWNESFWNSVTYATQVIDDLWYQREKENDVSIG